MADPHNLVGASPTAGRMSATPDVPNPLAKETPVTRKSLLAFALTGASLLSLTQAHAAVITWDLGTPSGLLGVSQDYTAGPIVTITATGFVNGNFALATNQTALFGKSDGAGEVGLGLNDDPTQSGGVSEHELHGTNWIQLDVSKAIAAGVTNLSFTMGSRYRLHRGPLHNRWRQLAGLRIQLGDVARGTIAGTDRLRRVAVASAPDRVRLLQLSGGDRQCAGRFHFGGPRRGPGACHADDPGHCAAWPGFRVPSSQDRRLYLIRPSTTHAQGGASTGAPLCRSRADSPSCQIGQRRSPPTACCPPSHCQCERSEAIPRMHWCNIPARLLRFACNDSMAPSQGMPQPHDRSSHVPRVPDGQSPFGCRINGRSLRGETRHERRHLRPLGARHRLRPPAVLPFVEQRLQLRHHRFRE